MNPKNLIQLSKGKCQAHGMKVMTCMDPGLAGQEGTIHQGHGMQMVLLMQFSYMSG